MPAAVSQALSQAGAPPVTRQRSKRVFDSVWVDRIEATGQRQRFADAADGSVLRLEVTAKGRKLFRIYVTDPREGRQVWVTLGEYPTDEARGDLRVIEYVDEARKLAASTRDEIRAAATGERVVKLAPPGPDPDGYWLPCIAQASREHIARSKLAPKTVVAYTQACEHLLDVFGDVPVDSIKRAGLRKLVERGTNQAVRAAFRYHATLWNQGHSALLDAVDEPSDALEAACGRKHPGVGMGIEWDKPNRQRFETFADFATFWQVATEWSVPEVSVMTRVQALMGCRVDELKRLRWEDVKLDAKPARLTFRDTKTREFATFPVPDAVADLLRVMGPRESGWVFVGRTGSHIKKSERVWDAVEEALGYRVNTHALRRFYISVAEVCGVSPSMARLLTGHVSGGTDAHGGVYLDGEVVPLDVLAEAAAPIAPRLLKIAETGA